MTWLNRVAESAVTVVKKVMRLIQSTLMKWMPKRPDSTPCVELDWRGFKKEVRWWHVVVALLTLLIVFRTVTLILKVPLMDVSLLSMLSEVIGKILDIIYQRELDLAPRITGAIVILFVSLVFGFVSWEDKEPFLSKLPRYAVREELLFRAGAENWGIMSKIKACLIFGLMHFSMIIIPIGVALSLSIGGAVFMVVYWSAYNKGVGMKQAVIQAALVHTTYNIFAFILMYGYIFYVAIKGFSLLL